MTDLQPEEFSEPVEMNYLPINDLHVLGGTANNTPHVFLSVSILNAEGEAIKVTYGMTPWEAIKLGVTLGEVAVTTVESTMEASEAEPPEVPMPLNRISPYL